MKSGGVLILGTPNSNGWGAKLFGRYWISWHTPYHLQLFSKKSLELAANKAGLVIESVKTITSTQWLYLQSVHLFTRPRMGIPSPFWAPNVKRTSIQQRTITLMTWINYTKIFDLITRLFDSLGIGDNYLFFLRKS
jgi:hypothetical protein